MAKRILYIIKNETILSIAVVFAVISAFIIRPDIEYLSYIDFRTLSLLFCLMAVMAGLQSVGVFELMAKKLLGRINSIRGLSFVLVMLCFFFSMLITNDVALITFVPFTFVIISMTGILSSQIISNVPAALLLSGFTDNINPLIIGVNLGGLGTLIGSMASLISFKMVSKKNKSLRGRYLIYFTAVNVLFLIILSAIYYILNIGRV